MDDAPVARTPPRVRELARAYGLRAAIFPGAPARDLRTRIAAVDADVFRLRVAPDCMAFPCSFRATPESRTLDACCSWGVDADERERARIEAARERVEPHLDAASRGGPWFREAPVLDDDFPSGRAFSTRVRGGACVFLRRAGGRRGCALHVAALAESIDPHRLKPMFCSLFPLLIERGVLTHVRGDLDELTCSRHGPSVYRAQRGALEALFGGDLVGEIDGLEREEAGEFFPEVARRMD